MALLTDTVPNLPVPAVAGLSELTRDTQRLREIRDDFRRRLHELLGLEASRLRTEIEELDRRCAEAAKRQQAWEQEFPPEEQTASVVDPGLDPGLVLAREWQQRLGR